MKRLEMRIKGRVQGVSFRYNTKKQAQSLNVAGYVKNLPDGTVEVKAEGPEQDLEQLKAFCEEGPTMARVEDMELDWKEHKDEFSNFEVRY